MLRQLLIDLPVEQAAPHLLGSILISPVATAQIVEVEAYAGIGDPGSHSFSGVPTARTQTMFGPPGHAYIYFTYGNHWMLNVSAHADGVPGGILIRAAKPLTGIEELYKNRPKAKTDRDLLSGPGKLCAALGITREFEGCDLLDINSPIHIFQSRKDISYVVGPRVGLAQGKGENTLWRFVDSAELMWASMPRKSLLRDTVHQVSAGDYHNLTEG